jgi:hypothetical protein
VGGTSVLEHGLSSTGFVRTVGHVWRYGMSADYFVIACQILNACLVAEMSMQNDLFKKVFGKKR